MASSVNFSGSIIAGPIGSGDCGFPSGVTNISFTSLPPLKAASASGYQSKVVNSPSAFVELTGVGTGETVTQANFLFLRTSSPMQVRLTMNPSSGSDVVSILFIQGVHILELPSLNYLKLLEAQGVGTIEYFVSGNQ